MMDKSWCTPEEVTSLKVVKRIPITLDDHRAHSKSSEMDIRARITPANYHEVIGTPFEYVKDDRAYVRKPCTDGKCVMLKRVYGWKDKPFSKGGEIRMITREGPRHGPCKSISFVLARKEITTTHAFADLMEDGSLVVWYDPDTGSN